MTLIVSGKTLCMLCRKVIERNDHITGFPAFLPRDHALWRFSDAAMHTHCFTKEAEADDVQRLYAQFDQAQRHSRKM